MSDRAPPPFHERLLSFVERRQTSLLVLILVGFGTLFGGLLYELRQTAWNQATTTADNLLGSISREIGRDIASHENVLRAMRADRDDANVARIALSVNAGVLSGSGELFTIDRDGAIIGRWGAERQGAAGVGAAAVLAAMREAPRDELYVGPPVRGADGLQRLWIGLPLRAVDGTIEGAVAATLRLERWRALFERFAIGPKSAINLFHTGGRLTMRVPYIAERIGEDFLGTANLFRFNAAPSGRFVAAAAIDGVERAYSFTHIGAYPLILNIALSTGEIFAASNQSALVVGVAFAVLTVLLGSFSLLLMRELRLRRTSELRYRELSGTDALTGVANRRSFDHTLNREWRRAVRDRSHLSLLIVDVDHFKSFNDLYGHPAGDLCLSQVADAIAEAVGRPADLVARYGGEEFAVLLPGTPEEGSLALAERIRRAVSDRCIVHAGNGSLNVVTISIGVATSVFGGGDDPVAPVALVGAADRALYAAKRDGRNRVVQEHDVSHRVLAPALADETARLAALALYESVLSSDATAHLSELAAMAAAIFQAPMAMVSFVGSDRVHFVGRFGSDVESARRKDVFCRHTILGEGLLVVEDLANDPRFAQSAFVTGAPNLRFYAGAPLRVGGDGPALGAVCVMDTVPRPAATPLQAGLLKDLSKAAMRRLEERRVDLEEKASDTPALTKAG